MIPVTVVVSNLLQWNGKAYTFRQVSALVLYIGTQTEQRHPVLV
ncbi:MAG: hypothetical protein WBO39_12825 [Ferruginibacter sp.]